MPWYKNTLFVITGDHIGPPSTNAAHMFDNYRVPIVFFHPGRKLPQVNRDRIVQHVDIEPSILDFLGIAGAPMLPFGHTIFDAAYDGLAARSKRRQLLDLHGKLLLRVSLEPNRIDYFVSTISTRRSRINRKSFQGWKTGSKHMFNGSTTASLRTICIAE